MKTLAIGAGVVAGAALTMALVNAVYPDVQKRMARDGKRMLHKTQRAFHNMV